MVSRLLLGLVLLVLAACQADVAIDLDVAPDGSGTISVDTLIDAEADQALGGFAGQLRTSDLERAGWEVLTVRRDDGTVGATATKTIAAPSQWQGALDEIAGPGVFTNVQVTSTPEFANANQQLAFGLDLRDGWDLFSDDGVAQALGGEPLGAPIDTLTGGREIDDIISVVVTGTVASDDTAPTTKTFMPRFDQDEPLQVEIGSNAQDSTAKLVRWIAIALFSLGALATVLAVTGVVLQRRSDRLRPNPTPKSLATRVPGAQAETAATPAVAAPPKNDSVRLVVVEPLSVLYQQSLPADAYLLPFVREHDGTARADTILEGHRALLAGSSDTGAFWELCGMSSSRDQLDANYVSLRSLRSGAAAFLAEMQSRRIPVAATSNDAASWSEQMRDRDRLSAVWPWLVSSKVGTTTANGAMFEVLRRESGVSYGHCLYVDTHIASLDAAKELGMKTALLDSGDLDLPDVVGHPIVTDFKGLVGN